MDRHIKIATNGEMVEEEINGDSMRMTAGKVKEAVVTGDRVNHPSHYNTDCPTIYVEHKGEILAIKIECIDVIRNMPTWKGNAIKYLWRIGLKQEEGLSAKDKSIEDLNKSIWYIEDKIKELKNDTK